MLNFFSVIFLVWILRAKLQQIWNTKLYIKIYIGYSDNVWTADTLCVARLYCMSAWFIVNLIYYYNDCVRIEQYTIIYQYIYIYNQVYQYAINMILCVRCLYRFVYLYDPENRTTNANTANLHEPRELYTYNMYNILYYIRREIRICMRIKY